MPVADMPQIIEMEVIIMTKKNMSELCVECDIVVPRNATKKQLEEALIDEYHKLAAVVTTDEGRLVFEPTDKPTAMYTIGFTFYVAHEIKAESEKAAREWMEEYAIDYYKPGIGEVIDRGYFKIDSVYKREI